MPQAVARAFDGGQARLDRQCGRLHGGGPRRGRAGAGERDQRHGGRRAGARPLRLPAPGCCICRPTSCSTANRNRAYLPDDAPHPLSVYGASKLGGERRCSQSGATGIVLRTAWVYAAAGRNFVLTMLRLMREREQVRVVGDQIGAPTWASGLAHAIWESDRGGRARRRSITGRISAWRVGTTSRWPSRRRRCARGLLTRAAPIVPICDRRVSRRALDAPPSACSTLDATRALVATTGGSLARTT